MIRCTVVAPFFVLYHLYFCLLIIKKTLTVLFSTAYLPPIEYIAALINEDFISIEQEENYIKQTFRNRCEIYSANGKISLTIPVNKTKGNHTKTKDIEIDNSVKWQLNHWRALVSAYNHSPFFLFYAEVFEKFYFTKHKYLLDFNHLLLGETMKLLKLNPVIHYTENFEKEGDENLRDYRYSFNPKKTSASKMTFYRQVFTEKFGFIPNLSIVDLIFNTGSDSISYLNQLKI